MFKLAASFASTSVQMLFFWGVELLLVLLLWKNLFGPQNNFLMAVVLVLFWTILSVIMTVRLYGKTKVSAISRPKLGEGEVV